MVLHRFLYLFLILCLTNCSSEADLKDKPVIVSEKPDEEVKLKELSNADAGFPAILFNDPQKIRAGSASEVISNRLISLINAAPEHSSIYVSIYLFEYHPIIEALSNASRRGVRLYIMTDMSDRSDNHNTVSKLRELEGEIQIVEVRNDASSIAINHNKYVLFSKVLIEDGTNIQNIVFQTSQNFHSSSLEKLQDAVIISDEGLYKAYLENWDKMKALASSGMKHFEYGEYSDNSHYSVNFYPKRKNGESYGEDSVIEILRKISAPSTTKVTVAMSDWSDSRAYIINELLSLLSSGASIEVITKSGKGPEVMAGLKQLEEKGAFVKVFNMAGSGPAKINIHTKILMLDGVLEGKESRFVMTGTQNFTLNALWNNNETSLFLYDDELIDEYENFITELKSLPGIEL